MSKMPKGSKSKPAKSSKADGTPKKRWSAAERASRGHGPRHSGGRPRSERAGFPEPRFDRDERRDDRAAGVTRDDRPRGGDRPSGNRTGDTGFNRAGRDERRGGFNRDDRGGFNRAGRDERGGFNRGQRDDRRGGFNRDDRGGFNRGERDERRGGFNRDDRGGFTRGGRDERGGFNRDDRGGFTRDDRGGFTRGERDERRGGFGDRGRGPVRGERSFVPRDHSEHRERRDDRRERIERPRFERDDRRERFERPERDDADQMDWTPAAAVDAPAEGAEPSTGGFAELGLRPELVYALSSQGITDPFPIQAATIPDALAGRDVLGRGQTGSGKTLGFGLPMLSRLAGSSARNPRGIVLVPTRELAMQVADVLSPLAATLKLSVILVAGGMAYGPQVKALSRGVDVVVATPGRLIDLMDQGAADLSEVQVAVLDEADHMADLGFLPDVRRILDSVPAGGQRLLFSATLDRGVDTVVREYLESPVTHEVDPETAAVSTMEHLVIHVRPADKQPVTAEIANRKGRTVAFVRTQRGADRVAEQLREAGVMAGALHGGLTQGARSRILAAFKEGTVPVLVATDVAARGIHVDDVGVVLQIDPPAGSKDYLHRAGRTARAGGEGTVVTLALPHQRREMQRLAKRAGVDANPIEAGADDERVYRATGARQPSRGAISEAEYADLIAPPKKQHKPRRSGFRPQGGGPRRGGGGRRGY